MRCHEGSIYQPEMCIDGLSAGTGGDTLIAVRCSVSVIMSQTVTVCLKSPFYLSRLLFGFCIDGVNYD